MVFRRLTSFHWVRHFPQHAVMSLWRKKPLLLAIVMVSTVLVLAFQYHSVSGGGLTAGAGGGNTKTGGSSAAESLVSHDAADNVHAKHDNDNSNNGQPRFAPNSVNFGGPASQVRILANTLVDFHKT